MKRFCYQVLCLSLVLSSLLVNGCGKKDKETNAPDTKSAGKVITAVWASTVSKKPIVKAMAKKNGVSEVNVYLYSFQAPDQWPSAGAYGKDDFFIDFNIKGVKGKELTIGEYKDAQFTLTVHTKTANYGLLAKRGSIIITQIDSGKLKGEFKVDDGYVKVSGPFEMDLL